MQPPVGTLDGTLVLDLSRLLPGPYCSGILADHGARVVAIEDRRFAEEATPLLDSVNRNKEHMTLNLKSEAGREVFLRLVERADVVLEGFRPGVTERLGVDYASLRAINPRLVYCSLTGYGQTGPYSDRPGHDVNFLGYSGVLSLIGERSRTPVIPGAQLADISGGLNAAVGILLALFHRERSGEGQYLDVSLTDCAFSLLPVVAADLWTSGRTPERGNELLSHGYACYDIYRAGDDRYLTLGAFEPRFWLRLCELLEIPQYGPFQFDDARQDEIRAALSDIFATRSRSEWAELLATAGVCLGEVLDANEAFDSELARARDMVCHVPHPERGQVPVVGIPVKLSARPGSARTPAPGFGADTSRILAELGYSGTDIEQFEQQGAL